ncbi:unnamed protein product [Rotaria sordida]|uniref:MAM domain-containing protein n=2 Tax=Rotaria sordida TaxID=392033 RepID=A0A815L3Z9_9BILA|nr:unnamed protein product [Rotaria sordida]CAF3867546.1 unnamed protein product [Rotaria sordida]CAF3967835.1 unnamed protein product [Rotaria sordida]
MVTIIALLVISLISALSSKTFYCDFEKPCEDFVFDSHWTVEKISSHIDHTYQNLSGHYITYTNTSVSQPLTIVRTQSIELGPNETVCITPWMWSIKNGEVNFHINYAQGDDLQSQTPGYQIGFPLSDSNWTGGNIGIPYTLSDHFYLLFKFISITSPLDIDDLSVSICTSSQSRPPTTTVFDCDFDKTLCPEFESLSNYSYTWSTIEAEEAQNYTATAPSIDYSIGNKTGHYIWLNNSDSLQFGGVGYLKTPIFRFTQSDPEFCLNFQYYAFDATVQLSKLSVLALSEGNEMSVQQVWPINPINYIYTTNRWSWAFAPLPLGNFSLLFRMDSQYEVGGSFAIDSISISSCDYTPSWFSPTSRLKFTCDFDSSSDSSCGIQNDYTDFSPQSLINTTIQSPNTISDRELGPRQASGWSGNQFLYWSRSKNTSTNLTTGYFKTPLIETNRDMCIRFSYFVNSIGVQPNEKNTKIDIAANGCTVSTVWSNELDDSFGWQLVEQRLPDCAWTESIYFRITQKRPTRVAVAFDDISIAR